MMFEFLWVVAGVAFTLFVCLGIVPVTIVRLIDRYTR